MISPLPGALVSALLLSCGDKVPAGDGGTASEDGGSSDGGSSDGGSADGGSVDGGSVDGGSADGGTADGGGASGWDTGVEREDCRPAGVDPEPIAYTLPSAFAGYNSDWLPFPDTLGTEDCPGGSYSYTFRDLRGDGRPTLLLLLDDCGVVPEDQLGVFPARASGYTEAAVSWPLPETVADNWVHAQGNTHITGTCGEPDLRYWYAIEDLTGDGLVDLVIFYDQCRDPDIGTHRWEVHAGSSTGFAEEPLPFQLPAAYAEYRGYGAAFAGMQSDMDCPLGEGQAFYMVRDLTGDGIPDLVFTYDECGDPALGTSSWDLYAGTGTGFEETPVPYALPPGFEDHNPEGHPFDGFSNFESCGESTVSHYSYSLLDLSGDGRVDLVLHYSDCAPVPGSGDQFWYVYEGSTTGFAEDPTPFALPSPMADHRAEGPVFPALTSYESCSPSGDYGFGTFDASNDGFPDLVEFWDDCLDPDIGRRRWDVYEGSPAGFSSTPRSFDLPEELSGYATDFIPLFDVRGEEDCDEAGSPYGFSLLDQTGDGLLDLVLHFDQCRPELGLGRAAWAVYPGICEKEE